MNFNLFLKLRGKNSKYHFIKTKYVISNFKYKSKNFALLIFIEEAIFIIWMLESLLIESGKKLLEEFSFEKILIKLNLLIILLAN